MIALIPYLVKHTLFHILLLSCPVLLDLSIQSQLENNGPLLDQLITDLKTNKSPLTFLEKHIEGVFDQSC